MSRLKNKTKEKHNRLIKYRFLCSKGFVKLSNWRINKLSCFLRFIFALYIFLFVCFKQRVHWWALGNCRMCWNCIQNCVILSIYLEGGPSESRNGPWPTKILKSHWYEKSLGCMDSTSKSQVLWNECSARCLEIWVLDQCSLELFWESGKCGGNSTQFLHSCGDNRFHWAVRRSYEIIYISLMEVLGTQQVLNRY